ncbi:hypothetical protein ACP275_09G138600 [Erythranthe tilingii]
MDDKDRTLSDLVGLFKSWIPWRSEPAHVSRDFWMPDQSCRVCYECDSQFTLFNRRHHCRLCGRIFCAKCTSNSVPTEPTTAKTPLEEWDKIRVCNYCFKQWKQDMIVRVDNGVQVSSLDMSSISPSATSFLSTKSSGTCGSSSITFASMPAGLSPYESPLMETSLERQVDGAASTSDHDADIGEPNMSQKQFGYCQNRSDDDDDDEFGITHFGSCTSHFSQATSYYSHVQFNDINSDHKSLKVHPDRDAVDSKSSSSSPLQYSFDSPLQYSFDSPNSEDVQQNASEDVQQDISDECEAPSSLYVAEDVDTEPVDFENNGVLWLPPEPEDEEDEREALLFDDEDDDGDAAGEWGYLRHSSSFGSGDSRNKDKSNDQKRALKNVVEGHFRALIAQLLQVENLLGEEENDNESWLEIITALSWEAATLLKPDTSKGGQMDPGKYAKVKCLTSGLPSESMIVKGIVCKKNVAHRRMASKIEKPRLLILGGALEYHRISNALSSFDTLLQQEMDHLKMAVAKIEAHNPDILLVEKSVSRYAQDYLLAKDISLVLNIKRPLLERISRCTGAQIVPSLDHLSSQALGYCDNFHVERFSEVHNAAGQGGKKLMKTLMYFEGCPKPLGCTILLRGANEDELKKVKHVVQYGIFAAYHLAVETSFLADEGATLPELPLSSPITVALPDKLSNIENCISIVPQSFDEPQRSNSMPSSDQTKVARTSFHGKECSDIYKIPAPSSQSADPLVSSSDKGFQHCSLNELSHHIASDDGGLIDLAMSSDAKFVEAGRVSATDTSAWQPDGRLTLEEQPDVEAFPPSPSDHQGILVSLSSRCVWKGTVCERSHMFRIKYYGSSDKPLGRLLRDHLFDQSYVCRSCEMPAEAHVECYTHQQGSLTISVKRLPEIILPGENDGKIWMWHRCLRCPRTNGFPPATRRVVMSDAAWGLSFGKFLELSFSNHAAASRVASCGHSLHRDCLRFYGFGKMVACFRYASIHVHSVYLPPSKLEFNYECQEWLERELNEVVGRAELLFSDVLNALRLLIERKSSLGKTSESKRQIADLEVMLQKEKLEFEESLQKLLKKEAKKGQPIIDILELNRVRRQLIFQSYVWDHRLIYADTLDTKNQSDDMEVASSEPIKKPLVDTENILDINIPVLGSPQSLADDAKAEQNPDNKASDTEGVHNKIDLLLNCDHGNKIERAHSRGSKATDESDPLVSGVTVRRALSEGQAPICLSDTLDAAWTGESNTGLRSKDNGFLESVEGDKTTSAAAASDKLDMEDFKEDLRLSHLHSVLSTKNYDAKDDTGGWLGMPFVSFYRSFNIKFLRGGENLDTLGAYNPVYISSYRESELQGGARLLLPVGVNDTIVPVYDDEPTSIISYALVSPDYVAQMYEEPDKPKDTADSVFTMQSFDAGVFQSFHSLDEMMLESYRNLGSGDDVFLSLTSSRSSLPLDPLSYTKASHVKVSFADDGGNLGKVKYTVTCYFAKRFEALRRMCCPSELDFVRSLSRCKKWGAQGGKSNVFFAKTLDDRFIIKQVTKTELESFTKFASEYFKYLSESICSRSPTCLAKILGIYQVTTKHLKGGKETKMDLLVMENLLFGRNPIRLYDLKGSSRSRYNPDSSGSNKVLLDQNLIESMPTSPIFVGNRAKRLLERAVWNDTGFLANIDVMDYSLLVGVDEEKQELVLGIIDFMRQYTWDKHLETWVKASGILGGPKNASPTIISPEQYKKRFRKAMTTYFLMVPDKWSPASTIVPSKSQTELSEDNSQNLDSTASAE